MTRPILHYDTKAEEAFIGSLLHLVNDSEFNPALLEDAHNAASSLEPDDVHSDQFRLIFAAVRRFFERGESFDQILLVSELNGSVENAAGVILEAMASVAAGTHIEGYANIIRKAAEQRRAYCLVNDALNDLGKTTDATVPLTKLRAALDTIVAPVVADDLVITTDRYVPFPASLLPVAVANYVTAASCAIGCDASFIALPLLGCLARAIGNKRVIRTKRTWAEPAIIWGAIIGKSGTHKTPALQASTFFLNQAQSRAITEFEAAGSKYDQDLQLYDRDYAAWKRSKSLEPPPWKPEQPACERFITTDCTIEALAALLHSQFDGVLVCRDELAGWLGGIAEYKGGKGSDMGHWLASWSAAPLTVDRKTGATKMIHIPRAAVSIVGGIQPGVLRKAIGQEHLQDGLCARLLMAMPEPKPVRWTEAIVDPPVEEAMANVFARLIGMPSGADGDGNPEPFAMQLNRDAKHMWIEYYNRHRAEITDLDDDLAAAWSKLEAYAARFALIFQLCSWASGEADDQAIDESAMASGIALSDWFGGEAKRVYGLFSESNHDRDQRELLELIEKRGGRITAHDLQNAGRKYRGAGQAQTALDDLRDSGYGRWDIVKTAGRPRSDFVLSTVATEAEVNETAESGAFASVASVGKVKTHSDFDEFERQRTSLNGDADVPF